MAMDAVSSKLTRNPVEHQGLHETGNMGNKRRQFG
jgi:hypothetical protein